MVSRIESQGRRVSLRLRSIKEINILTQDGILVPKQQMMTVKEAAKTHPSLNRVGIHAKLAKSVSIRIMHAIITKWTYTEAACILATGVESAFGALVACSNTKELADTNAS